ncbi:sulfurtransferase TusA family protein [Metallosphaera tengchongensis]|uniref:Sulfurtransferase TusA family protein n=1 Tax=Metallosphaera tengchongensis TaxID=1532350 RepID=A0A6N0NWB4_9CREN|nr:sulfurtransferase TusA family protein [Metallosphaera tengchongensis]QKR00163.1 sulfurtransferase TusA family protein [Metallosphaera tengchongensis]
MSSEPLKTREPDDTLDVIGESCPVPEMMAGKKLRKMKAGQVLEVLTDHQPAVDVTLPSLCKNLGYPYAVFKDGDVYKFRILKVG